MKSIDPILHSTVATVRRVAAAPAAIHRVALAILLPLLLAACSESGGPGMTAPTSTPSGTSIPTRSATPVPTWSATPLPTQPATAVPTRSVTPTATAVDTPTPTSSSTPAATSSGTPTATIGAPVAGMAEGYVDLPVGVPLGGYSDRCRCLGGFGRYDARTTAYNNKFTPSVGVQSQPRIVALWLDNGQQDLVFVKMDAIYVFEGIVTALEQRLSAATGRDMKGHVVVTASHSHSAPANFDQGYTWYLGGDKFNREVFERLVASMQTVALAAWNTRQPAAIGIGQRTNWDPHDAVYHDRRGENDVRMFFDDIPAGPYKDPYLTVLRVDTAAGAPIGMFFAFAIHGTVADEGNQLWSVEASGHVEAAVAERFDTPVVIGFMQHGAGDASPSGVDDLFARMESIGDLAADTIVDLWRQTPTSEQPIRLDAITRSLDTRRDVLRVHRDYGTLQYTPYNPDPSYHPDDIVYDYPGGVVNAQGQVRTPIDEFNTQMGGAFCGSTTPIIPGAPDIGSNVFPYSSCANVAFMGDVLKYFFDIDKVELPLPESLHAKVTASRIGPLPILTAAGEVVNDDVLLAFFPGEPTSVYTEQFRRRATAELGVTHPIAIGYAQDHQGYLLVPEDWLLGGYEPTINIWGPLQGEHIMEGLMNAAGGMLRGETPPPDPLDVDPVYPDVPLPHNAPDLTLAAGTALTELPKYALIPIKGLAPALAPPQRVRRIQDVVQYMWDGGDPGVDLPLVYLEVQNTSGAWEQVRTVAGRPVSSPMHDMLLATTPDPLTPFTADQRHIWWLGWQAVAHVIDRPGLPVGTYRFHVNGKRYAGGAQTWPWPTTAYELISPSFEVVPADISLSWDGTTLTGSIDAPATGFRLVDIEGSSTGANPVREAIISAILGDGTTQELTPTATSVASQHTAWTLAPEALATATAIEVVDKYGNRGQLPLH